MKKFIFLSISIFIMVNANTSLASIDCTRPVARVWAGYGGNQIYVVHNDDGYRNSRMQLANVGDDPLIIIEP